MPIGSSKPRVVQNSQQARGFLRTTTRITDKSTGGESSRDESRPLRESTFDRPHATIGVRHSTTMSIKFQTVVSESFVQLPVEATEDGIADGYNRAWAIVEQELAKRAGWAKEVLETLVEARNQIEGK